MNSETHVLARSSVLRLRVEPAPDASVGAMQCAYAAANRFQMRNARQFYWITEIKLVPADTAVGVHVVTLVNDRDASSDSAPIYVTFGMLVDLEAPKQWHDREHHERQVLEGIRRAIAVAVEHELHENLYVDGVRRWDPHDPMYRPPAPERAIRKGTP